MAMADLGSWFGNILGNGSAMTGAQPNYVVAHPNVAGLANQLATTTVPAESMARVEVENEFLSLMAFAKKIFEARSDGDDERMKRIVDEEIEKLAKR